MAAAYFDAGDLAEDERIDLIGATVMKFGEGKKTAFIVEDYAKADRYCRKLTERYPGVVVCGREFTANPEMVTVTVMPLQNIQCAADRKSRLVEG